MKEKNPKIQNWQQLYSRYVFALHFQSLRWLYVENIPLFIGKYSMSTKTPRFAIATDREHINCIFLPRRNKNILLDWKSWQMNTLLIHEYRNSS